MNLRTSTSIFIILFSISISICDCNNIKNGVQIVTYGEPCATIRQLPVKIEGPRPPQQEQKIPISLDFRVVSDMYVQPRRTEYPIEIDTSCTTSSPPSERTTTVDTLRGNTYTYNTYVPSTSYVQDSQKIYNYAVEVPVSTRENIKQYQEQRMQQRLKGLTSRIDRLLVPACEVSSSSSSCQC